MEVGFRLVYEWFACMLILDDDGFEFLILFERVCFFDITNFYINLMRVIYEIGPGEGDFRPGFD